MIDFATMGVLTAVNGQSEPFPGATQITNLLPNPLDLTSGWITAGTPTITPTQITWTDGSGVDRIRTGFIPITAGNRHLLVLRCYAGSVNDSATVYYALTAIRCYSGGGWVTEDRLGVISPGFGYRNDGVMRNYAAQYLPPDQLLQTFDLNDSNGNEPGQVIVYESAGLYDIEGLSGWVYDSSTNIRFNLDQKVVLWGDSVCIRVATYLSNLLNIIHSYDEAIGGETSAEIKARFDDEPDKHVYPTVLMVGHNNITTDGVAAVQADIVAMTAALDAAGSDYRVLTLISNEAWTDPGTAYTKITTLNAWIISEYGARAVDVYTYLRTKGDGGVDDLADIAAGIIPRSLRDGPIHLNSRGKEFLIDVVFSSVNVSGWRG